MKIENNILKDPSVKTIVDPKHLIVSNKNKYLKSSTNIVLHTSFSTYAKTTIKNFKNSEVKESMHIVIDRRGEITQLIPFDIKACHVMDKNNNVQRCKNDYSIGITLINAGKLICVNGSYYMPSGNLIDSRSVMKYKQEVEDTTYWQTFPDAQISSLRNLCKALMYKYPSIINILENSAAAKGKIDPGPAFPSEVFNKFHKL
jgi:N-acetylmuramoyl-L-alanine amidase